MSEAIKRLQVRVDARTMLSWREMDALIEIAKAAQAIVTANPFSTWEADVEWLRAALAKLEAPGHE